jgi:hypothetical protein
MSKRALRPERGSPPIHDARAPERHRRERTLRRRESIHSEDAVSDGGHGSTGDG